MGGTGVHPQLLRMMLSAFLFILLGYASSQADDHIDSLECCKYKRVPGLTPKSGDYFLVEHRDDLPDFCKDGCVYVKKSSGDGDNIQYVQYGDGDEEFCFKPSSTYTAQCQEEEVMPQVNCVFTDICSVDPNNQSYTIAGIQTHQSGILKFEFDDDVSGSWLRFLNLPSNSSAFTCLNKTCTCSCTLDAGTWTVLVTSGDTLWNSIPLITTYYVNDINYCEGEEEEEQTQVVPQVNCDFTDICSVDPTNQSYTIAGIQTFQGGILKFEFDNDVSGSWLRILNLPSDSSPFTCLNKICTSRDQNPVDAGTWTVLVTSGDTQWNSIPLITTYYVNDMNYCEGEDGQGSTNYMTDHGITEDDMQDHSDMENPSTTTTKTTTMDHQDNMSNHGDMTNHGDMSDHGSMMSDHSDDMSDHGAVMAHSK